MLVIKDLYSDISDCFWLFYGSKYIFIYYNPSLSRIFGFVPFSLLFLFPMRCELESYLISSACYLLAIKFTEIKSLLA